MENNFSVESIDNKYPITLGVILGIISFISGIISLIIMKNGEALMTMTFISFLLTYILFIVVACYFAFLIRKKHGGYWEFSTALKRIFIMVAVSAVISTVCTAILNSTYPLLQEEAIDNTMNLTIESLEAMSVPDEQIDSTVEQLEAQKEALGKLSVGQIIKGLAITLLLYFVFALILAAIFKKERPVFVEQKSDGAHPWQNDNTPEA